MCHLLKKLAVGLDVVSEGELLTATTANMAEKIFFCMAIIKVWQEIETAIDIGARIVIDNQSEIKNSS